MSAWRRIGGSSTEGTILAVDFDSTLRPEAGFRRFAGLVGDVGQMWLTTQPDAAEERILHSGAYLDFWAARPEGRVAALVGYCVGCVFLPALADAVEREQGSRPAMLLINPEPVVTASIGRDFAMMVDGMTVLAESERAAAVAQARRICDTAGHDFPAAAGGVLELYEKTAGTAFDRLGLDDETREELLGMFRSYVSYLCAAHELEPERGWALGTALTSAQSSPGARHAASEQRFPIATAEMLDDERVAAAATTFFSGATT